MKITFLGTGTSQGVPIINCDCAVCQSDDARNKRLRTSARVDVDGITLLIDTSPDLRQQLLTNRTRRLDAVLYTHSHADHIYGMDELRRFNYLQRMRIPAWADPETGQRLMQVFDYAFGNGELIPGLPNLSLHTVDGPFRVGEVEVIPVPLWHGNQKILGYRIGDFAWLTDVSAIPQESFGLLQGLKVLALDALRGRPHPTHFHLEQSLQAAAVIGAEQTWLIHMSHDIDHIKNSRDLPENIFFAYDNLQLTIE
jgi:phosphoribosyl 1,2-cyclic phosphate phosphodiesterase